MVPAPDGFQSLPHKGRCHRPGSVFRSLLACGVSLVSRFFCFSLSFRSLPGLFPCSSACSSPRCSCSLLAPWQHGACSLSAVLCCSLPISAHPSQSKHIPLGKPHFQPLPQRSSAIQLLSANSGSAAWRCGQGGWGERPTKKEKREKEKEKKKIDCPPRGPTAHPLLGHRTSPFSYFLSRFLLSPVFFFGLSTFLHYLLSPRYAPAKTHSAGAVCLSLPSWASLYWLYRCKASRVDTLSQRRDVTCAQCRTETCTPVLDSCLIMRVPGFHRLADSSVSPSVVQCTPSRCLSLLSLQ